MPITHISVQLKKMASISYAQLLASLRGQADSQSTPEPKATQTEATSEAAHREKISEGSADAPDDSEIAAEEVESAEVTKEPDAESDIASSRSQSPIPRPRTPHPPQELSMPSEIASSSTSKPQSRSKPPMEERKERACPESGFNSITLIIPANSKRGTEVPGQSAHT